MKQHTVTAFDEDLSALASAIATMGGLAEQLVAQSVQALLKSDPELAQQCITADKKIDELERQIEERAITIIARRQPMAQDLREIIAALRIATDLERVADLGKNIARRALAIDAQKFGQRLFVGIEHLSALGLEQMKLVLDSYAARDVAKAREVWAKDDDIDAVYTSLFRELLTYMMEDPRNIGMCTHLLFCAKNIERIGDHATNIAETICYLVTGEPFDEARQSSTTRLTQAEQA
ncbi:phosphate signaling complex protein PhoU [Propylenella binzhouense]|uniref:Phosphate-specific transport system accessory protein PhoU n=1 Tax=Propylenella binzhouense TaxID=2555902 RepID=A0A964WUP7_9HYPH|nr:phosphate signaling complex protein PhoU [Propylenella binzhouense]MYZ49249.1 phosphate signaling complex protein PhoU [Propylenella binzhouense]